MKYADPLACPACRAPLTGGDACAACGFLLGSAQARQLWALFQQADQLVAAGRQAAPAPAAPADQPAQAPQPQFAQWQPTAPTEDARSWSTGSILLGLGAVFLIVGAIIFATVAWGSLGIAGRAAILLAATAIAGWAAVWATRRRLFGTAESLWAVFFGLIAVDVLAAVAEGLFGLAWRDFAAVSVVWTVAVTFGAAFVVRWARSLVDRELVLPQLAAAFAVWVSTPAVIARLDDAFADRLSAAPAFWAGLIALAVPTFVAIVSRVRAMRWALWPSLIVVGLLVAVLVVLALESARSGRPPVELSEALPALTLMAIGSVGAAAMTPRWRPWLSGLVTVLGVYLVGAVAAGSAWRADVSQSAGMVAAAVAVAVLAVLERRDTVWSLGVRWGAVVSGVAVLVWSAWAALSMLERIEDAQDWYAAPPSLWARPLEISFLDGRWALAAVAALLVAWWGASRWLSPRLAPQGWWTPLALIAGGAGVVTAVSASLAPYLTHAATLIGVGALLALGLRRAPAGFALVPPVVVALALAVVPGDAPVTAWAWGLAAAGFGVVALAGAGQDDAIRRATSAGSTALAVLAAIGALSLILDLSDLESGWHGVVIAGAAAATLLLSLALDEHPWHRTALEIAAGLAFAYALLSEVDDLADLALLLTIGAVAAAITGLLDEDREYLRWVGVALIGAAWVARLAASEVETIEAYTAPFAVALLAAGLWRLRTRPAARTWTSLSAGLTMALLPSLPQALDDPTSLRAGLLALAAAIALAVGALLRWGAPILAGSAVLLLLVLANVGPTALAMPRWILITVVGLVLLAIGATWEKRVAEGRALAARLAALR